MTFEEIINEHNDELIFVFGEHDDDDRDRHAITNMLTLSEAIADLNQRTQAKLAEVFDNSFLDLTKIEGEK